MTIDRAVVEKGARLAAEATPGPWSTAGASFRTPAKVVGHAAWGAEASYADAAFIAHWNPEFAAELARELQRLWRVEEVLTRAAYVARHLLGHVSEFTGVIGPAGEREDDYIRDQLAEEIEGWATLANSAAEEGEYEKMRREREDFYRRLS